MAMLLTLVLFVAWTAVGLAVLNAARFRGGVRKLLLAPTVGFAAFAVVTYIAVRSGYPVGECGVPVGVAFLVGTAATLWRTRTKRSHAVRVLRRFGPFAAVLGATLLLTAWPLFRYGFDWVANGNDDMANYCIGATGFQAHGYLRVPTPAELRSGQDISQPLWFLYHDPETLTANRCGSELTRALTATWTGLTPQQVFMPVIAAFNAALVAATAGLVLLSTRRRAAALWAAALLAVSSQTGYGVVQQLIAQASGLALLCTSLAMVCSPFRRFPRRLIARRAAVCGLVFAGLIVFYPETVPFLVGACVVLGVRDLVRRRPVGRHLWHAGAAITTMALLLPLYLYGTAHFLRGQANQGTGASTHTLEIFPYFMTPRGPALVWGLLPTYEAVPEPRQAASMILGLALLVAVLVVAVQQFRRGRAFAAVLLVMAVMGAMLYVQQAAFGLFKLAMFAQPFLWATVAAWLVSRRRRWVAVAAIGLVVAVAGANARTQFWYVKQSTGYDSRVDLPAVTQQHLMEEFRTAAAQQLADRESPRVLIASENNVLVKLLATELLPVQATVLTMAPFQNHRTEDETTRAPRDLADTPAVRAKAAMWIDPLDQPALVDPVTRRPLHRLMHVPEDWTDAPQDRVLVVSGCGPLSVFNRLRHPESGPALLCAPLGSVHNFAVFRDATGARQSFLGMNDTTEVALYRLEPDPTFRSRTLAGVGRHLVVDVLNPSPKVRVVVNYTSSFRPESSRREVIPVEVVGNRRVSVGATGDGSARLVSPPLEPQQVGPSKLLAIDFNTELLRNPNHITGFEKLWGENLPRDRRMITGHVRDISIVSEEEYAAFQPPEKLASFPNDLTHPHLEYSGLYEEGWAGKTFKVRLTQAAPGQEAVIRGQIPSIPGSEAFETELTVLIDGTPAQRRVLRTGDFEVRVPAGPTTGPRWIECRFSNTVTLPSGDGRSVVALLKAIGFEPADATKSRPPERLTAFPADLSHPKLEATGIDLDGWVGKASKARLWFAGPGRDAVVRGNVPVIAGAFRTEMTILIDGAEAARRTLAPGDFEVRVPVGGRLGERWIECRFSAVQQLPAPDTRAVGARLHAFGFEPTK